MIIRSGQWSGFLISFVVVLALVNEIQAFAPASYGVSSAGMLRNPGASSIPRDASLLKNSQTQASATSIQASQTENCVKPVAQQHQHTHKAAPIPPARPIHPTRPIATATGASARQPVQPVVVPAKQAVAQPIAPRRPTYYGSDHDGYLGWFPYSPVVKAASLPVYAAWIPVSWLPDTINTLLSCDVDRYPNYFEGRCFAECPPMTQFVNGKCLVLESQ